MRVQTALELPFPCQLVGALQNGAAVLSAALTMFSSREEPGLSSGTAENSSSQTVSTDWITLNVSGKLVSTTLSTLRKVPTSRLARWFGVSQDGTISSDWKDKLSQDDSGAFLIDADPK